MTSIGPRRAGSGGTRSPFQVIPAYGAMDVGEIMTAPVVTVQASSTVEEAAGIMLRRCVGGRRGNDGTSVLVGSLTTRDLLRIVHDADRDT